MYRYWVSQLYDNLHRSSDEHRRHVGLTLNLMQRINKPNLEFSGLLPDKYNQRWLIVVSAIVRTIARSVLQIAFVNEVVL